MKRTGPLDLLTQHRRARLYDANTLQLEEHWQRTLADFETFLRGFSISHQALILRTAKGFASILQRRGTRYPDEDCFLEWLDTSLTSCQAETVYLKVPRLERFCQFLVEISGCPSNPVREWRRAQVELYDALRRRRRGEPARLRPPRFQSPLADRIEAFLAHKRALGRKYGIVYALELFDHHLRERQIKDLAGLDRDFFSTLLGSVSHWQSSTFKTSIGLLKEFFRFLVRRGDIPKERSPARFLPRVVRPPRVPHIFTVKEISTILSHLREARTSSAFDRQMLFTFFHLIYACGLRISEGVRLKVQDVDLEDRTLFIYETKFGKSRHIPFGHRAAEYLSEYHQLRVERLGQPESTAPFFVRAIGFPYSRGSLQRFFGQACRQAGAVPRTGPKPRVHDLRHAFAVHRLYKWYLEGADPQKRLQLLSLYMGHQQVTYTEHYLHLAQDLLRIAGRPLERPIEKWLQKRQKCEDED